MCDIIYNPIYNKQERQRKIKQSPKEKYPLVTWTFDTQLHNTSWNNQ